MLFKQTTLVLDSKQKPDNHVSPFPFLLHQGECWSQIFSINHWHLSRQDGKRNKKWSRERNGLEGVGDGFPLDQPTKEGREHGLEWGPDGSCQMVIRRIPKWLPHQIRWGQGYFWPVHWRIETFGDRLVVMAGLTSGCGFPDSSTQCIEFYFNIIK